MSIFLDKENKTLYLDAGDQNIWQDGSKMRFEIINFDVKDLFFIQKVELTKDLNDKVPCHECQKPLTKNRNFKPLYVNNMRTLYLYPLCSDKCYLKLNKKLNKYTS